MPAVNKNKEKKIEAAKKMSVALQGSVTEAKYRACCDTLSKRALLGTAYLPLMEESVVLKFNTYNRGRQIQNAVLQTMAQQLTAGGRGSANNYLVVAIDKGSIKPDSLVQDNQGNDELQKVEFTSREVSIEVLAGWHRIMAARSATESLEARWYVVDKQCADTQESDDAESDGSTGEQNVFDETRDLISNTMTELATWPTQFYDIDELRKLSSELSKKDLKKRGKDALLHFLAENTNDRNALKGCNETFADILARHLYSPGPAQNWEDLILENRILNTVCYRFPTWNLATTAVRASKSIYGSWVAQADRLNQVASNPSCKIICIVTTHLLLRFLTLFQPTYPPDNGKLRFEEVERGCKAWAESKHSRLNEWMQRRRGFKGDSEARYMEEKGKLLDDLTKAGNLPRKALLELEREYMPTDAAFKAAICQGGFTINSGKLGSHVCVSEQVMVELNRIYNDHYRPGGVCHLRRCFNMMGPSEDSREDLKRYQEYLADVKELLVKLASAKATQTALATGDLQAFGLQQASSKLNALFSPVLGRICLPLPTVDMLEDLRVCLEADSYVMSEVGRWFDGLGEHMIEVKGHISNVFSWSEVIAFKLGSLCPDQSDRKKNDFVLWVFQSFMEYSELFEELRSEMVQCGVVRVGKQRVEILSGTTKVGALFEQIKDSGLAELQRLSLPSGTFSPEWSLICNTAYNVSLKAFGGKTQTKPANKLCCRAVGEADANVLESRRRLLQLKNAMNLRLSLWLHVNMWLLWNPSGIDGGHTFSYWDMVPDQIPINSTLYSGDKAKMIRRLFQDDMKRLEEIGNYLTRSPALCNNPDSPARDAVISEEIKVAIDGVLDAARLRMDKQRLLTCPPDQDPEGQVNRFKEMIPYRHSQVTFKSFTDEEIRRQAGKEVLPNGPNQNQEGGPENLEGCGGAVVGLQKHAKVGVQCNKGGKAVVRPNKSGKVVIPLNQRGASGPSRSLVTPRLGRISDQSQSLGGEAGLPETSSECSQARLPSREQPVSPPLESVNPRSSFPTLTSLQSSWVPYSRRGGSKEKLRIVLGKDDKDTFSPSHDVRFLLKAPPSAQPRARYTSHTRSLPDKDMDRMDLKDTGMIDGEDEDDRSPPQSNPASRTRSPTKFERAGEQQSHQRTGEPGPTSPSRNTRAPKRPRSFLSPRAKGSRRPSIPVQEGEEHREAGAMGSPPTKRRNVQGKNHYRPAMLMTPQALKKSRNPQTSSNLPSPNLPARPPGQHQVVEPESDSIEDLYATDPSHNTEQESSDPESLSAAYLRRSSTTCLENIYTSPSGLGISYSRSNSPNDSD